MRKWCRAMQDPAYCTLTRSPSGRVQAAGLSGIPSPSRAVLQLIEKLDLIRWVGPSHDGTYTAVLTAFGDAAANYVPRGTVSTAQTA